MDLLLKKPPNKIILEDAFKISFSHNQSKRSTSTRHSLQKLQNNHAVSPFYSSLFCKISPISFHAWIFELNTVYIMGNENVRSRRVEPQSSGRDENTSETSFTQRNATLVDVFENVKNIFDWNSDSELTEPSQISNEIEAITQRLSEQSNNRMTQIEPPLKNNFEEILKEIITNRESSLVNDGEDAEKNRPSVSNSEKRLPRRKHASNNEIDQDKNQDNCFQSSELYELRLPSSPFGVANETSDDTMIINENRQEADYHMMTGGQELADYHMVTSPTKNILRQSFNNTNITNTLGRNAEYLFLKHSEPPNPVNQIPQAIEKRARRNSKPSTSKDLN